MREFELKSDYKQTSTIVIAAEIGNNESNLYSTNKKQMFSGIDSSPDVKHHF